MKTILQQLLLTLMHSTAVDRRNYLQDHRAETFYWLPQQLPEDSRAVVQTGMRHMACTGEC